MAVLKPKRWVTQWVIDYACVLWTLTNGSTILLWFVSKMFLKSSCIKSLIPKAAMIRNGALEDG